MKTKALILELRQSNKKSEQGLYGLTETMGDVTKVFLNIRQTKPELINTFFHEMTHVYLHWMGSAGTGDDDEKLARLIGNVAEPCFRNYKKKRKH